MPKCVCCGKNINSSRSTYRLVKNDDSVICDDCYFLIFGEIANPTSLDDFESGCNEIKSIVSSQFTQEGQEYIDKYIKQKRMELLSNPEDEEKRKKIELKKYEEKRKRISEHMLTTGFNFEGFKIINYKRVISGETVLGTGFASEFSASFSDFFGNSSDMFSNKLRQAKEAALEKLILKSVEVGGDAIIGVDFDYITFTGNLIGVVANGTSVLIEKLPEE